MENEFLKVLGNMELNGFYLDVEKWMEQFRNNKEKCDEALETVYKIILDSDVTQFKNFQLSLFPTGEIEDELNINLASSKQVIELCKCLGIPTEILDKKRSREREEDVFKDSVEEAHLKRYAKDFSIIPAYLKYRRYLKAVTTYGKKFVDENVNPKTGRVHSSYWPIVDTGRMASRRPNMQNIPSKRKFPGFRECFTKSDNTMLIVADYSAQESRCMADVSGDRNMITFFNEGDGDLHKYTGELMFGVEIIKTERDAEGNIVVQGQNEDKRDLAKILNFGIPFGMSAHKLSKDFNKTKEEAQVFIDNWFEAYPSIEKLFDKSFKRTVRTGYVLIDEITRRRSYGGKVYETYVETQAVINRLKKARKKVPKRL